MLPAYIARTAPDLVPVLPGEVSLRRSYWIAAAPDIAETAQVRLTQRFLHRLVAKATEFFG